ncbi:DUF1566 domain-containing protein [Granulosicoccaceae sp. 1_MG-2023]|nr:DUF1566 domain-containing protein [Granulosicoccaceae sp. 1_MG-2023]
MSIAPVVRRSLIPLMLLAGISSASASGPRLPDTGQTQQYDTQGKLLPPSGSSLYTGQDASIKGAELNYVDNGDGTVTDRSTGLMWTQDDSGKRMNWVEALEYADKATIAGHDDWRLPNAKELQSLVDYEKKTFPAINTDFFNTSLTTFDSVENAYYFWTSTTQGDFKWTADYVAFGPAWSKKNASATAYFDWHGAGAQRSDPKTGEPADYELASEMASDFISIRNWVRLVRDVAQ